MEERPRGFEVLVALGSADGTSRLLGKGWAGGDARMERTTETIQTQPQPCHAVLGVTGAGPCVRESPDASLSDEFKTFSFSVFINGEWPLVVGTDDEMRLAFPSLGVPEAVVSCGLPASCVVLGQKHLDSDRTIQANKPSALRDRRAFRGWAPSEPLRIFWVSIKMV